MSGVPKLLIVYAIAIPLAIALGFLVSDPQEATFVVIGSLFFLFALPGILKWHHLLLILFWNSAFNIFFLPAQPHMWLLMAFISFGISLINNVMGEKAFISVPELSRPLIFFAVVVMGTALARGGLGARFLGASSYGGKGYFYVLGAIVGYFAFTGMRVPLQKAKSLSSWYFLTGVTFCLSNVIFVLGPSFYLLYLLLPPEYAVMQAEAAESSFSVGRVGGLPIACMALVCFLLARYGLRGVLSWRRPWLGFLVLLALFASGFGGFRSVYILYALIFLFQFFVEGLYGTILLPICVGVCLVAGVFIVNFSTRLPLTIQRAVSFLPVQVDSSVKQDADYSVQWRLDMWSVLLPEVPKYLLVGKGYRIDPEDLYLADLAAQMGLAEGAEVQRLSGDYHSGPFSIVLTFGIFGAIAFLWLLWSGARCLYRNLRYGPESLRQINTFLLAYFLAHTVFFFTIFGDIRTDLFIFTGALGFSVTLNGGVARRPIRARSLPAPELVTSTAPATAPQPA